MPMPARRPDDEGYISLIVALLITAFVGLAALVVDLGLARDQERTAQNAADAAALAAAQRLAGSLDPEAVTARDKASSSAPSTSTASRRRSR
jgi:Flp pilus assembly protein TadG